SFCLVSVLPAEYIPTLVRRRPGEGERPANLKPGFRRCDSLWPASCRKCLGGFDWLWEHDPSSGAVLIGYCRSVGHPMLRVVVPDTQVARCCGLCCAECIPLGWRSRKTSPTSSGIRVRCPRVRRQV